MSLEAMILLADGADTLVRVHVQPGATRPGIAGVRGDAVRVRVQAPPVDDRATAECLGLLASVLGVRRGDLELVAGARARRKVIRVRGMPPSAVASRLGIEI